MLPKRNPYRYPKRVGTLEVQAGGQCSPLGPLSTSQVSAWIETDRGGGRPSAQLVVVSSADPAGGRPGVPVNRADRSRGPHSPVPQFRAVFALAHFSPAALSRYGVTLPQGRATSASERFPGGMHPGPWRSRSAGSEGAWGRMGRIRNGFAYEEVFE